MFLLASFPLGCILKVPVRVHWSLPAALITWIAVMFPGLEDRSFTQAVLSFSSGLSIIFALSTAVLMHELAHAWAARHFGVQTPKIYLHILGGLTLLNDPAFPDLEPHRQMVVYVAGPLANLLGCIIALLFGWAVGVSNLAHFLALAGLISLITALFNLLPIWPLDGGQFFRSILLSLQLSPQLSDRITLILSLSLGLPLAYFALRLGSYWVLSTLGILMVAAVLLLGFYSDETDSSSSVSTEKKDAESFKRISCRAVPPSQRRPVIQIRHLSPHEYCETAGRFEHESERL